MKKARRIDELEPSAMLEALIRSCFEHKLIILNGMIEYPAVLDRVEKKCRIIFLRYRG